MAAIHSQLDPLPQNLPFEIISKTIGRGAYASLVFPFPSIPTSQLTPQQGQERPSAPDRRSVCGKVHTQAVRN